LCCSGFFVYLTAVRLSFLKSPTFFIAAPVILVVCLLEIAHFPYLNRLEWMTFDLRVRLAHNLRNTASDSVTNLGLVEIADKTIYEVKNDAHLGFDYGLYWPRDVYAAALKELTLEGARAVAFDVLFAELRDDQSWVTLPDGTTDAPDNIFAAQLKQSGNVILAADKDEMPNSKFRTNAWRVANIAVDRDADGVLRRDRAFQEYRIWDPAIIQNASALAWNLPKTIEDRKQHKITFVSRLNDETWSYPIDEKGRIPSTSYLKTLPQGYPDKIVPWQDFRAWSMGILLAAHELNLDLDHPVFKPGQIILHGPDGLTRTIPVDDQNYFYIDWSLAQNDPQVPRLPFELLLAALVERNHGHPVNDYWKDRLAVIGSQATGNDLADVGATPLAKSTFLVTKHINVARSVITGRFVQPTPLGLNLALIVFVGILSAWITWVVELAFNGTLLVVACTALFIALNSCLYVQWRIWLPIFLPAVGAGLATHVIGLIYRVRFEQSQKKLIKQHFSRVLSPDVVNELLQKATIETAGQRLEITIFFADVRGFTEMTDSTQARADAYVKEHHLTGAEAEAYFDAQAKDTLETVSTYLGLLADIVKSHKGTLDKYIGDCVMAFWGAPLPNPHHALDAVRAAIEAQRAMAELNLERQRKNKQREEENPKRARNGMPLLPQLPVLSMGTGINTGGAIVGFMGSETHQVNYTAFGREVNLASRLEGVSGHGRIIIGEATFAALKRDDPQLAGMCLDWGLRKVKGFREPVRIYEVRWQPETGMPQQPGEDTDIRITNANPAAA
jgi:class 3 adenylate cyclase/CHASE2 domain-containing sensor protein